MKRLAIVLASAVANLMGVAAPVSAQETIDGPTNPLGLIPRHATIGTRDVGKEADWYVRVLGFHEESRAQGTGYEVRHLAIPGYRIYLVWHKDSSGAPQTTLPDKPGLAGLVGLGWLHIVFTAPNLNSTLIHLEEMSADIRTVRDTHGSIKSIMVRDPEHNEIEIDSEDAK